jgi:hypothetical protein
MDPGANVPSPKIVFLGKTKFSFKRSHIEGNCRHPDIRWDRIPSDGTEQSRRNTPHSHRIAAVLPSLPRPTTCAYPLPSVSPRYSFPLTPSLSPRGRDPGARMRTNTPRLQDPSSPHPSPSAGPCPFEHTSNNMKFLQHETLECNIHLKQMKYLEHTHAICA